MQRNALRFLVSLCVCAIISPSLRAVDIITTYAGNGTNPHRDVFPTGEGLPGPQSPTPAPNYVFITKDGNLYITGRSIVRRMPLAVGTISTLSGLGSFSTQPPNGTPAINLNFDNPRAAVGGNGTILIVDWEFASTPVFYTISPFTLTLLGIDSPLPQTAGQEPDVAVNPVSTTPTETFAAPDHRTDLDFIYIGQINTEDPYANIPPTSFLGTGIKGFSGDGGPAKLAQVQSPSSLVYDLNGNLYFLNGGTRIRRIDGASGIIQTVAGNGTATPVLNGTLATNSGLGNIVAITADVFGNIFFADDRIIYKINTSGVIEIVLNSTAAAGFSGDGGSALDAKVRRISSMTCDADGNLYIADFEDHRVRKVAFGPRISSALTANAVEGQPFSYSIVATGSKTITYSTSPAVPGLTLNGNVLSGTPTAAGDYDVTITATNSAAAESKVLKLKVLAVNSPAPPVITSALTATGMVNTAFSYTLTATGAVPIAFNATGLPSGLTFAGATLSGTPATAGVFTITLTATNSSATDTQTLTLRIDPQPTVPGGGPGTPGPGTGTDPGPGINLPGGGGSNSVIDSDGDGFSDEMETQLGSDPKNPNSTPLNNKPAGPQSPFDVAKVSIKLNFTSEGKDNLSISGKLPITDGFIVGGQKVITDVGGVIREFQLNDKGQGGPIDNASFKISIRAKKGVVLAQEAKFSIRIGQTTIGSTFDDEGFPTRTQTGSVVKPIPVAILFNGVSYRSAESVEYTSRNGKSASIK